MKIIAIRKCFGCDTHNHRDTGTLHDETIGNVPAMLSWEGYNEKPYCNECRNFEDYNTRIIPIGCLAVTEYQ